MSFYLILCKDTDLFFKSKESNLKEILTIRQHENKNKDIKTIAVNLNNQKLRGKINLFEITKNTDLKVIKTKKFVQECFFLKNRSSF